MSALSTNHYVTFICQGSNAPPFRTTLTIEYRKDHSPPTLSNLQRRVTKALFANLNNIPNMDSPTRAALLSEMASEDPRDFSTRITF